MKATGFDFARLNSQHRATGYRAISENGGDESTDFDYSVSFAAGGMYSTTGDLYKWIRGMASSNILQKQSFNKATTPFRNKYGYGMYIDSIYGKKIIAHGGLTFGFSAYISSIPEDDVSIIILNNVVNVSITEIAKDVLAILYHKPYKVPEAQKEIILDSKVLMIYVGKYALTPQVSVVFTIENGNLVAQVANEPKVRLYAQAEDLFFVKGTDILVKFEKDAAGNINAIKLIEGTRVTVGTKAN